MTIYNFIEKYKIPDKICDDFIEYYKTNNCSVRFHYNDNRKKIRTWKVDLKDNCFILFPSNCLYYIQNKQDNSLNYIQTILYDYI